MKKILLLLIVSLSFQLTIAQVYTQDQIDAAEAALAEAGVDEDEIARRLRARGIDLDNVQPEQLESLESDMREVIEEIRSENDDTEDAETTGNDDANKDVDAVQEKEVSSKVDETNPVDTDFLRYLDEKSGQGIKDSIAEQAKAQLAHLSRESANEIIRRMKRGSTLEEAIYDVLTEEERQQFRAKSDVYGMSVFFNNSVDFYRTSTSSSTPDNYVLDVGDKIAINIFGASQADLIYEIQEDGFIRPSGTSKIYLRGVSLSRAKSLLRSRFGQAYRFNKDQFEVNLFTARTITVNIFGEVNAPGSYTISALNTAVNALIAAGGPDADASIRNIRIMSKHGDKVLDVYEFIHDPRKARNFYLHDNDVIFVPKYDKRVAVRGNGVRRPATFELKEKENYFDLVELAGGYSTTIHDDLVQYISQTNGEEQIKDYTLADIEAAGLKLKDRDVIVFHSSLVGFENYVTIGGPVRHPGQYELTKGMRLDELLKKARLEDEAVTAIAYLTRKNIDGTYQLKRLNLSQALANSDDPANITLEDMDQISVFTKTQFVDKYQFNISGAVRKGGDHFWDPETTITLYDAIMLSSGLKTEATEFGYIVTTPPNASLSRKYKIVNISAAIANPNGPENIKIQPNDRIVVPSRNQYLDQFHVNVSGAVRSPGQFVYDSSLTFKQLLVMAGGLKMEAASNKIDIFRLKVENNEPTVTYATTIEIDHELKPLENNINFELKPYDHIVVRTTPEFEPIKFVNIQGEVKYPGQYALMHPNERLSSLIDRAGGYTDEAFPEAGTFFRSYDNIGFVVTRLDLLPRDRFKERYNIVLKEGDFVTVPNLIDVVKIDKLGTNADSFYIASRTGGADLNIVVNHFNRRAKWYVKQFAGGFSKDAKRNKTTVTYPNGRIKRTRSFLFIKCYPKVKRGSEINLTLKEKARIKREKIKNGDNGGGKGGGKGTKIGKDKKTVLERLTELNAITSITTSIMLTTQTLITVINGTK